ncbi:MAG: MlaD family protein [Acidimicrobiia bacterium]|jgi:phospholipid/cholesterol/gamma-HCH transport system substrate-binding protein
MPMTTERNRNVISGAVGLLIVISLITVGIKASFGAYDGGYELRGTFAAAGQGLLSGSDVKIRGVNVGEVSSIRLVDNRALIRIRIEDGTQIPEAAQAVIRPKTLFGEKFIDILPGDDELTGPYLADGDEIVDTLGGFELEQVLTDAYPVLEAVNPAELAVILDELATAGRGLGPSINRSIVNGATLAELGASNDAEFRQFTSDLALLAEELDVIAPDLVAGARDLNVALPTLNARSDQLDEALTQTARLAADVADVLEANEAFTTNALTDGSRTLQTVFDRRSQIQPLLLGVARYTRTLAEAVRIEVGDGTLMAAVKAVVSVQGTIAGHESPGPDDDPRTPVEELLDGLPQLPLPELPVDDLLNGSGAGTQASGGGGLLDLLTGGGGR